MATECLAFEQHRGPHLAPHGDEDGEPDNAGYKLRGHQFTYQEGRYRLETILPGQYGGRTPHIHVKVEAPNGRILTTQL